MKKIGVIFAMLLLYPAKVVMAIPPPPEGGGAPPCFPPPCIPIDGGIVLVLIFALVLGLYKLGLE